MQAKRGHPFSKTTGINSNRLNFPSGLDSSKLALRLFPVRAPSQNTSRFRLLSFYNAGCWFLVDFFLELKPCHKAFYSNKVSFFVIISPRAFLGQIQSSYVDLWERSTDLPEAGLGVKVPRTSEGATCFGFWGLTALARGLDVSV